MSTLCLFLRKKENKPIILLFFFNSFDFLSLNEFSRCFDYLLSSMKKVRAYKGWIDF